jgi:hypothetical protein
MLSGCSAVDGMMSGQPSEVIAAQFAEGWKACGTPLTAEGAFDQAAVSKAGWKPTSRILHLVTSIDQRAVPLNSAPVLRDDEYEATVWTRQGQDGTLNISRWGVADGRDLADQCDISGKLNKAKSADVLADRLSQMLGRPADRKGETARGGDFLTPRFDTNPRAWYWQMPQHDVYLMIFEGTGARLEILAMPNRVALYEYPLEEPTRRIFIEGQKL